MSPQLPRLISVIHLPALAGAPGASGLRPFDALARAGLQAVKEARSLAQAGFEGIILENFGDVPFYWDTVPPETVASMAVIAGAVREAVKLPLGINVLRNDGFAALAIAAVTGCEFIRVNVVSGVAATDQGLIQGEAARLARERARLGADVAILADALVKHARTLSTDEVELAVEENGLRAMADGVIITGSTTGRPIDHERLIRAAGVAREHGIPLWIGSGSTVDTLAELLRHATGVIVGSAIRRGGKAGAPLDPARVRAFVKAWKKAKGGATARAAKKRSGPMKKPSPKAAPAKRAQTRGKKKAARK
jgi:membrane complex biogenesis BtpA family protein